MIKHMVQSEQGTSSWVLNPCCLIDRFLDYIERLRSLIVPGHADHLCYTEAEFEAASSSSMHPGYRID
jgi:hypothetical protein